MRNLIGRLMVVLAFCWTGSIGAATLFVSDGKLTGIDGLLVEDNFYDVRFKNGSYNSVYSEIGTPTFIELGTGSLLPTLAMARVIDGTIYANPELIAGCLGVVLCHIATPDRFVNDGRYYNWDSLAVHTSGTLGIGSETFVNFGSSYYDVIFAVYTPSAIPIPAAVWLFGSAVLGLAAMKRRKA